MSVAQRVASDLSILNSIPLPPGIGAEIFVTCRELKKSGWSDEQIETLNELIAAEKS